MVSITELFKGLCSFDIVIDSEWMDGLPGSAEEILGLCITQSRQYLGKLDHFERRNPHSKTNELNL